MEYYEQPNGNVVKLHNGLDIIGVTKAFDTKKGRVQALEEINLHIRSKEVVSLLCTSGS